MLAYWLVLWYGTALICIMMLWAWTGRDPKPEEPNVLDMTGEERDERLDEIVRRIEQR